MTDPDFKEVLAELVGSQFGAGNYGAGIYGGAHSLFTDDENPQPTNWTEVDE